MLFHCNNCCTNAPHNYVIRTLPLLCDSALQCLPEMSSMCSCNDGELLVSPSLWRCECVAFQSAYLCISTFLSLFLQHLLLLLLLLLSLLSSSSSSSTTTTTITTTTTTTETATSHKISSVFSYYYYYYYYYYYCGLKLRFFFRNTSYRRWQVNGSRSRSRILRRN